MTKTKECDSCSLAVALGTTLRICSQIGEKKKCTELKNKIVNEEIEPDEVFKQVRQMAKGHTEELEILDIVDEFMKEAKSGKKKRKKKRKSKRR